MLLKLIFALCATDANQRHHDVQLYQQHNCFLQLSGFVTLKRKHLSALALVYIPAQVVLKTNKRIYYSENTALADFDLTWKIIGMQAMSFSLLFFSAHHFNDSDLFF